MRDRPCSSTAVARQSDTGRRQRSDNTRKVLGCAAAPAGTTVPGAGVTAAFAKYQSLQQETVTQGSCTRPQPIVVELL